MEIDLAQAGVDFGALPAKLRAQVCVVGGGIAGLILAHRLMLQGHSVTLLEAGGRSSTAEGPSDPFGAELEGTAHAGTREARVCALGGCSVTWGGQLLPLPEDADWAVPISAIRKQEQSWRMPYDQSAFFQAHHAQAPEILRFFPELTPRLSRFVPFSLRNLAHTLGKRLIEQPRVNVVLRAAVTEILLTPQGDRVTALAVRGPGGQPMRLEAEQFVLAAGTVETCRLLLASRSVAPEGVGNGFGQVGLHFHDHLTLSAAEFLGKARARALAELRPWVFSERRRQQALFSVKLEPAAALRQRLELNPAMAHLTIVEPEDSGVGALRALLRARQRQTSGWARAKRLRALPDIVAYALRLEWEARVRHRRYVSPEASVRLQLNVAQSAPSTSRIRLSEHKDERGMPRAVVDWQVSSAELGTFRRFAGYLRERLDEAGLREGVAWLPELFEGNDEVLLRSIEDARHAMGGARMGNDPRASVVDPDLRVHGLANLSLASAAVFPDGRAQLPTLTLSALCVRLAEKLDQELSQPRPPYTR